MVDEFSRRIYSGIKHFSSCLVTWSTGRTAERTLAGSKQETSLTMWASCTAGTEEFDLSSETLVMCSPFHVKTLTARIRNLLKSLRKRCSPHQKPKGKKCAVLVNIIIRLKTTGTDHVTGLQ